MNIISYNSPNPYPPVKVSGQNLRVAELMLTNMSAPRSEESAVQQYLYNSFIMSGTENLANVFLKVAEVEMRHLNFLGNLVFMLGGDPRLWTKALLGMRYWTPVYLQYVRSQSAILENALNDEIGAASTYRAQLNVIDDPGVAAVIARIIEDEVIHIDLFKSLINTGIYN